jgi:3-dehydroquinate synthetase
MGVIRSPELFERLEAAPDAMMAIKADAAWAIARAVELKGEVVSADEREADLRMILNYGHTVGHALEASTSYGTFLHGEAVAIGMIAEAEIAIRRGLLDSETSARQKALIQEFKLPTGAPGVPIEQLWAPLRHDKKAVGSRLRWVLPSRLGATVIDDSVPDSLVSEVLREISTR